MRYGSTRADCGRTLQIVRITSGKVVSGKVVVDDDALPEGSTVTILAPDDGEEFELSPADEVALQKAIDQADRGETVKASEVLARLKSSN